MRHVSKILTIFVGSFVFTSNVIVIPPSYGAAVIATGTNPAICDQVVNDATGVSATRLSGGDCVVQFTSTAVSYQWTAPANLYSVTYLVVGGGGSGGTGWDTTGAAGGGGGMVLTGTNVVVANSTYGISIGAGGAQSINGRTSHNGYTGSASSFASITSAGGGFGYTSRANSGVAQAGGLAQVSNTSAPTGGSSGGGGTGGAGGGGAGGAGGAASASTAGSAGAGVSNSITGSAVTYGAGGAGGGNTGTSTTGTAGGANTGKGGGGGIGGGASSASGGAGGSGVVIIRYSTGIPTINSFALSGNPTTALYRTPTTINLNASVSSKVTFQVNGKRIAGCVSIPATGSGSSYSASCSWKPALKGSITLTAVVKPTSPGLASITSNIAISVIPRVINR